MPPRILYVSSHGLGSQAYGTRLRVLHVGRLLKKLALVDMALIDEGFMDESSVAATKEELGSVEVFRTRQRAKLSLFERVRHELDPRFLKTHPPEMPIAIRDRLRKKIEKYDLVWVHTIRTANATGIRKWPRAVLDIDDLPSSQYRSAAETKESQWGRILDHRMALIWRRREAFLKERFSTLVVCSADDRKRLGGAGTMHVVRNGFDPSPTYVKKNSGPPSRLGFIGTFNWEPNVHGVRWFLESVWPTVRAAAPGAQLRLIGAGSERFADPDADVQALGYVADPDAEMASWAALLVPLQIGAGTRIKIAEGFAKQIPVVSTSLGAYGYDVANGVELLLADQPAPFAEACLQVLKDPQLRERLTRQAHTRFLKEWTWDAQLPAVKAAVEDCLRRSGRSGTSVDAGSE